MSSRICFSSSRWYLARDRAAVDERVPQVDGAEKHARANGGKHLLAADEARTCFRDARLEALESAHQVVAGKCPEREDRDESRDERAADGLRWPNVASHRLGGLLGVQFH